MSWTRDTLQNPRGKRARQTLNWKTPDEVRTEEIKKFNQAVALDPWNQAS